MRRRSRLIRDLRRPKQMTFIELFFDLVYVFVLFRLSESLDERLTWVGAFEQLIMLMAAWWLWAYTNLLTDSLDSRTIWLQLLVLGSMYGALLFSTAIPEAFEQRGLLFALSYISINLARSCSLAIALRHDELGVRPLRAAFWFAVSAGPWLAGALFEGDARLVLWGVAIMIDYVSALSGWPTPGLGRTKPHELNLASGHFAERYRQFVIIALGATVALTGSTLHDSDFSPHRGAAFTFSFLISAGLFWVYFHRVREKLGPLFSGAPDPQIRTREAGLAHLVMVAGIVAASASVQLVIAEPREPCPAPWVALFVAGPALFLTGHALLARQLRGVAIPRLIGAAVLIAVAPALVGQSALFVNGITLLVLACVVGWDLRYAGIRPGEQALPLRF
ncbi:low temperature requirement protein LtrA [Micromonospora pisi]|uniref:Low temperature requirement protein LtrA n=1 Tax=Micromonospora pisi TaxID=589240 RepID=A0A495JQP2_9ACTN|nr:low temperature requirement protein A [Micromonospora pisi]RKR91293.1 low temperature requirement protein LtrA [Micromonospora pisi]